MENILDPISISFGHENLYSRRISQRELIQIIEKYSKSQLLDLFAKIDACLLSKPDEALYIQPFLSNILLPESTQKRINAITDVNPICFSMGQINLLRKLAIIYGHETEKELDLAKVDVSKMLLSAHDFHNDYDEPRVKAEDFESFCQFVIRNGYLNDKIKPSNVFYRAYQMYVIDGEKIFFRGEKNFPEFFLENVGIKIEQTMALSFALMSPLFRSKEDLFSGTTIIDPKAFFENIIINKEIVESIVENLTISLIDAKNKAMIEMGKGELSQIPIGYNLDIFKKTPLIKLNNGKLVCVNLSCLLEKITQNLIWLPKSQITNLEKKDEDILVNDLTNYRGLLFQEYVKKLCKKMEKKNPKIIFHYIGSEDRDDNEEVGDSILIQENELVVMELKSRQFNESFKYTGEWDKDKHFIEELIKKAVEQIEGATKKIMQGIDQLSIKPSQIEKVFPIIVTYESVPMHGKIQRYVRQQVKESGLLKNIIFAPLEVIHIKDLEDVMDSADKYSLIDILRAKHSGNEDWSETNFNNFFAHFISKNAITSNGWQQEQWDEFSSKLVLPAFQFKKR